MKKPCVCNKLGVWAIAVSVFVVLAIVCFANTSNTTASESAAETSEVSNESSITNVPAEMLPSLLIGSDDLPWDTVLGGWDIGPDNPICALGNFEGPAKCRAVWCGQPVKKAPEVTLPNSNIIIVVAITESPEEAVRIAKEYNGSHPVIRPEITKDVNILSFADRAWGGGSSVLFVRSNVVSIISVRSRDRAKDCQELIKLGTLLSRKVDAVLEGKPEPVSVLPLAEDQELRVDLEGAWRMRDLGIRLWGSDSKTIAIYDNNGIPRSLPAKQISTDDYVVPLRHLAAILGPRERVKIKDTEAKTTLYGKELVFNKGKAQMKIGQSTAQLNRDIEINNGEVLVPLKSLIHNSLGKRIVWQDRGDMKIGRVE